MSAGDEPNGSPESQQFLFPPEEEAMRGRLSGDELPAYRHALDESVAVAITDAKEGLEPVPARLLARRGSRLNSPLRDPGQLPLRLGLPTECVL